MTNSCLEIYIDKLEVLFRGLLKCLKFAIKILFSIGTCQGALHNLLPQDQWDGTCFGSSSEGAHSQNSLTYSLAQEGVTYGPRATSGPQRLIFLALTVPF